MSPTIHSSGGHSFVGCVNYLMHGAAMPAEQRSQALQKDDRVGFTMTGNLGTNDPKTAAKVMAAYAMKADDLKERAGVSKRGTPTTKGSVMHYTLSWREDEIENLSKQEMLRAALDSLKVLGQDTTKGKNKPKSGGRRQFADEHQFIIVQHTDRKHPHVHVVVNLTHPEHGRRLPSSNDQKKLQAWAGRYQKKHGNEHLCPKREERRKHNARERKKAKEDRVYLKAEKRLNRKDYDRQKAIQASQVKSALQEKQRSTVDAFKAKSHQQKKDQARQLDALKSKHESSQEKIHADSAAVFRETKKNLIDEGMLELKKIGNEQKAALAQYYLDEKSATGRLKNTWAAIKHEGWNVHDSEQKTSLFGTIFRHLFHLHADPEARKRPIKARFAKKRKEHYKAVDAKIAEAKRQRDAKRNDKLQAGRQKYQKQRQEILSKHRGQNQAMKKSWHDFRDQSKAAWQKLRQQQQPEANQNPTQKQTDHRQILPVEGSQQAAKKIDQFKHLQEITRNLENDQKRDQGDGKKR